MGKNGAADSGLVVRDCGSLSSFGVVLNDERLDVSREEKSDCWREEDE